jgi:hypothetical protein
LLARWKLPFESLLIPVEVNLVLYSDSCSFNGNRGLFLLILLGRSFCGFLTRVGF